VSAYSALFMVPMCIGRCSLVALLSAAAAVVPRPSPAASQRRAARPTDGGQSQPVATVARRREPQPMQLRCGGVRRQLRVPGECGGLPSSLSFLPRSCA
jgi:hypothetical protein